MIELTSSTPLPDEQEDNTATHNLSQPGVLKIVPKTPAGMQKFEHGRRCGLFIMLMMDGLSIRDSAASANLSLTDALNHLIKTGRLDAKTLTFVTPPHTWRDASKQAKAEKTARKAARKAAQEANEAAAVQTAQATLPLPVATPAPRTPVQVATPASATTVHVGRFPVGTPHDTIIKYLSRYRKAIVVAYARPQSKRIRVSKLAKKYDISMSQMESYLRNYCHFTVSKDDL